MLKSDNNIEVININTFGKTLRTERERQGIELQAVADETKIRTHYLNALEEEDFDALPPRVYATGFVATYARFLKLDADAMVNQFKSLAYHDKTVPPPPVIVEKRPKRRLKIPVKNIVAAAIFLVIAFWAGNLVSAYIAQRGVTPPLTITQEPPAVNNPPVQQVVSDKLVLAITARQLCWLEVSADGIEQFKGMIEAGENKSFEAIDSITIKAGNAGGIDLVLNNKALVPLGPVGTVVQKSFDKSSITKE